jgi:hypothetical protein
MKRLVFNFLVIAIFAFTSCEKDNDNFFDDDNVYVTGVKYNAQGVESVATVWKNGKAYNLNKETGWAWANSVFVVK